MQRGKKGDGRGTKSIVRENEQFSPMSFPTDATAYYNIHVPKLDAICLSNESVDEHWICEELYA